MTLLQNIKNARVAKKSTQPQPQSQEKPAVDFTLYSVPELRKYISENGSGFKSRYKAELIKECERLTKQPQPQVEEEPQQQPAPQFENDVETLPQPQPQAQTEQSQPQQVEEKFQVSAVVTVNGQAVKCYPNLLHGVKALQNFKHPIETIGVQSQKSQPTKLSEIDEIVVNSGGKLYRYCHHDRGFHAIVNAIANEHKLIGTTANSVHYRIIQEKITHIGVKTDIYDFKFDLKSQEVLYHGQPVGLIVSTANPRQIVRVFSEDSRIKLTIKKHLLYGCKLPDGWQLVKKPHHKGYDFMVIESQIPNISYDVVAKLSLIKGSYISETHTTEVYPAVAVDGLPEAIAKKALMLARDWAKSQKTDERAIKTIKSSVLKNDLKMTQKRLGIEFDINTLIKQPIVVVAKNKSIFSREFADWLTPTQWGWYIKSLLGQVPPWELPEINQKLTERLLWYNRQYPD